MTLPDRAALGTMHGKAAAIAPPLARQGIVLVVPEGLDTDLFGTFTAEIPRTGTMEDAARAKARAAIAATGLPIGIASEGVYGPHPFIPFLPIGREVLLWRNEETGQEVIERLTDEAPCYDHQSENRAGPQRGPRPQLADGMAEARRPQFGRSPQEPLVRQLCGNHASA